MIDLVVIRYIWRLLNQIYKVFSRIICVFCMYQINITTSIIPFQTSVTYHGDILALGVNRKRHDGVLRDNEQDRRMTLRLERQPCDGVRSLVYHPLFAVSVVTDMTHVWL